MTPANLEKFMEWYRKLKVSAVSLEAFFTAAYIHRYGKVASQLTQLDKTIIDQNLALYRSHRRLPAFVKQFWEDMIVPTLLRKGGKDEIA